MPRIGNDVKFALVPEYYKKLMLLSDETARTIPWLARAFVAHALERLIRDGEVDQGVLREYVEAGKREGHDRWEAVMNGEKSLVAPRRKWAENTALREAIARHMAREGIPSWLAVAEAAKAVGCSVHTLRHIMSGRIRKTSPRIAHGLAQYLGVPVEELFSPESMTTPPPSGVGP